ncbi:hypothetical protein BT69DRAFT_1323854 [Atractiella rhizophila]|nr:hypothetical protein BT69DRAFT_1323854 [Atractiella rhizophila]
MPPKVVRAHDGFSLDLVPGDLDGVHDLQSFQLALEPLLHIPHDSMIIMNSEGSMFRAESVGQVLMVVRSAASSQSITRSYEMPERGSNGSKDVMDDGGSFSLLFVFHRDFLNMDLETLLQDLYLRADDIVADSLGEVPRPRQGDTLIRFLDASEAQRELLRTLFLSLSYQIHAVSTAVQNLHLHCQSISSSYNNFQLFAQESVQNCSNSLESYHASMTANEKMPVDKALTSRNIGGTGKESGTRSRRAEEQRYLASYVNKEKMNEIYNLCKKTFDDVNSRNDVLAALIEKSVSSTQALKDDIVRSSPSDLEVRSLRMEERHTEFARIVNPEDVDHDVLSRSTTGEIPPQALARLFEIYDASLNEIHSLIEQKNDYTRYVLETLQKVSILQTGIVEAPADAIKVDEDMRYSSFMNFEVQLRDDTRAMINMEQFKYLSRLRDLVIVYTATVAEIVRRKTFARLLSDNSHSIANLLSKLSHSERNRRVHFRNDYSNKLPFQVPGLPDDLPDLGVPIVNVEMRDGDPKLRLSDLLPDLKMEDLTGMSSRFPITLQLRGKIALSAKLDEINKSVPAVKDPKFNPVIEAKSLLEKLMGKIVTMESDFEKAMAGERSGPLADDQTGKLEATIRNLEEQYRALEDEKEDLERQLQSERSVREQDTAQLESRIAELTRSLDMTKGEMDKLRSSLRRVEEERKADVARYSKEKTELANGAQASKGAIEQAILRAQEAEEDLRDRIDEVDRLNGLLETTQAESNRHLAEWKNLHTRLTELQTSQAASNKEMADLQKKCRSLEGEVEKKKQEVEKKGEELERKKSELETIKFSIDAKDKDLVDLRTVWEDEKVMLESQCASLEKEVEELTDLSERRGCALEAKTSRVEELETRISELVRTGNSERETLQRRVHDGEEENADLRRKNEELEREVELLQNRLDSHEEKSTGTVRDYRRQLDQLRREKDDAIKARQKEKEDSSQFRHIANRFYQQGSTILAAIQSVGVTSSKITFPSPTALSSLPNDSDVLGFDVDDYGKVLSNKLESLSKEVRKWQKECKAYKSVATEKITFRSFQVGDVALFLPTRDTTLGSWAAFNVGSPGYFLDIAQNQELSQMTKSRDWIVARITDISNHVVDPKDPSTNPFALIAGTKYFLLKVESWSPPARTKRREKTRSSRDDKKRRHHRQSTERSQSAPENEPEPSTAPDDTLVLSQSLPAQSPLPTSSSLSGPLSSISITDASFFEPPSSFLSTAASRPFTASGSTSKGGLQLPQEVQFPHINDQIRISSPPSLDGFSRISRPRSDYDHIITPAFLPVGGINNSSISPGPSKPDKGENASIRTLKTNRRQSQTGSSSSRMEKASPTTSHRSGTSLFPYSKAKKSIATTSTSFAHAGQQHAFPPAPLSHSPVLSEQALTEETAQSSKPSNLASPTKPGPSVLMRPRTSSQRASTSFFDSIRLKRSSRVAPSVDEATASELLRKQLSKDEA